MPTSPRFSGLIESRVGLLSFARPRPVSGEQVELPPETNTTIEAIRTVVEFWSEFDNLITVSTTAADITLPDVVVAGLPTGVVVQRATALMRFRMVSNSNASDNELNSPGTTLGVRVDGFTDAIILTDGMLFTPASDQSPGTLWVGSEDIKAEVDGNGTYNFQFDDAEAILDSLLMRDIQVGLRIEFTVPSV